MAWVTQSEVRERVPQVTTTVYSDANVTKIITRAEAEIKANGGRYKDMLQGRVFGEIINLATAGIGNKRLRAKGEETTATLGLKPVVSGSLFVFKNASDMQDYRHIRGDEGQLLTLTTHYSINTTTGVITFVTPLLTGDKITATYDFTMDTTSRPPQILIELTKSLAAYYILQALYGDNMPAKGEIVDSYKIAVDTMKLMSKDQFAIPEFDNLTLVSIEDWDDSEIKSGKLLRS